MNDIICLKTLIQCHCGEVARIVSFNKKEGLLVFGCAEGHETVKAFEEVENTTGIVDEFSLSSDGEIRWKCSIHGKCESYADEETDFDAYYSMDEGCPFCRRSESILHPYYEGEVKLEDSHRLSRVIEQLSETFNLEEDNKFCSIDESDIELETKEEVEQYIVEMVKELEEIAETYPEIEIKFQLSFYSDLGSEMGCAAYKASITKEQGEINCKWVLRE